MPSGSEIAAAAAVNATEAVERVASRQDNGMSLGAVQNAAPELAQAIQIAIDTTPEMQHVLNTERWWQKRSRWSMVISFSSILINPILKTAGLDYDLGTSQQGLLADGLTAFGQLWAGYLAYRAGTATRPLGAKPTQLPYPQLKG